MIVALQVEYENARQSEEFAMYDDVFLVVATLFALEVFDRLVLEEDIQGVL